MTTSLENYGVNLFKNIASVQALWSRLFGERFQDLWFNPDAHIREVVDLCRTTMEESVVVQKGSSHASLLLRDPLTDRLILEYSTKKELNKGATTQSETLFKNKKQNYDRSTGECFYNLCDSLFSDNDKKSDAARETRGLTGWVAVTGIPIRVNSSRSKEILEDMIKENALAEQLCNKYGYPIWGHRISEFILPNETKEWTKRFIAVPIKSQIDKNITIGVLRYSSPIKSKALSQVDMLFMESLAELVSVLENIKQVKILCNRDSELEKEYLSFQRTGDISAFLQFVAYSLRSRISSLYILLNIKNELILRLVDAFGISSYTGEVRATINDYSNKSKDEGGLTYELLEQPDLEPKDYPSVVMADNWRGRNTKLFYGKALSELSVPDLDKQLENNTYKRELLTNHPIKLLGCSFHDRGIPVGVLKVEFPKIFDDSQHYNKSDKEFLKKCAAILKTELIAYKTFISGEWFDGAGHEKVDEYLRFIGQIFRYKLLKQDDELMLFWSKAQEYAKKYSSQIQDINIKRLNERCVNDFSYCLLLKEINKIDDSNKDWGWVKKLFISESIKQIIEKSIFVASEVAKTLLV